MDDPRRILDEAARDRRPCRVQRPGGEWLAGTLCRLETNGLVINVPGHALRGGEELRLWLDIDGRSLHWEASVLRTGVPVPDRGSHGLLLGFLAAAHAPEEVVVAAAAVAEAVVVAPKAAPVLEVHLGTGAPVSLLAPPVELVEIAVDRLQFTVPRSFRVVFPENGQLRLRLGTSATRVSEAVGRVRIAVAGETTLMYTIDLEGVERHEAHQQAVRALRALLGR